MKTNIQNQTTPHTLESLESQHTATTNVALAWESLFAYFVHNSNITLPTLNTIAAIIQKLSAAHSQLTTLQLKSQEPSPKNPNPTTLTPETLSLIEQQLNLL